jgi:predicted nucleotidyltransferase
MESSKPTEQNREQVLAAAEACMRLLRERFGARRVVLFSSLAGQGPWHAQSDVALAVEGLTPTVFSMLIRRAVKISLAPVEERGWVRG